jgi:putative nucleotidyltransferase with HDIG domain
MSSQHQILYNLKISGNLPSMPQVLVQLIDSCHDPEIQLQVIARIIDKDAAVSAKVLQLVNSAFIGARKAIADIEQAVVYLGMDAVRNLAISISVQQVFRRVESNGMLAIDRFWSHSLHSALLARNIAVAVAHPDPAGAYLAGLLHDIGKLLLWRAFPGTYAPLLLKGVRCHNARLAFLEEEKLHVNHCQAGAWLCEQWRLPSLLADAIRYHHHPLEEVAQALPLTKIACLADLLSHSDSGNQEGLDAAAQLFALSPDQVASLFAGLDDEIALLAEQMGIRVPPDGKTSHDQEPESEAAHKETSLGLINRIRDISQLSGLLDNLLRAENRDQIVGAVEQGLKILFNEDTCLLLLPDGATGQLRAHPSEDNNLARDAGGLVFAPEQHPDSLPAQALRQQRLRHSFVEKPAGKGAPNLFDAQLLGLLAAEGMAAAPLIHRGQTEGLLLIGLWKKSFRTLTSQATPLQLLANHAAVALHLERSKAEQAERIAAERLAAATLVARKIAHEINNPLAILRNYLHILERKGAQGESIQAEVAVIDNELERIGQITQGLEDLAQERDPLAVEPLLVHPLLEEIVSLFRASQPQDRNISLSYVPCAEPLTLQTDANRLRQILQNLLGNALDAAASQGVVTVRSRRDRDAVVLSVEDNGPGVDPAVGDALFRAGVSTKTGRHSGLGLPIARSLAQRMGGSLTCATEPGATVFTLTLPA